MTYAMTLNNINFVELTTDEIMAIEGGVNWDRVFTGLTVFGGVLLVAATAPVTVPIVAICTAMTVVCAAYTAYGLRT